MGKLNSFDMKLIMAVKEFRVWSKQNFAANSHGLQLAWNAVAKRVKVSVDRCRCRWKSLRKTFRRHLIRKGTTGINSDWPYYEHMLFLVDSLHNIGSVSKANTLTEKENEESLQCTTTESQELPEPDSEQAEEPHEMEQAELLTHSTAAPRKEVLRPINRAISVDLITKEEPQIVRMDKVRYTQETSAASAVEMFTPIANTNHQPPVLYGRASAINESIGQEEFEERPLSWRTMDTDEQFLLSCLTAMQRLSRRRNALVRCQIQQLMYEAEFADEDEARNATYNNR